MAEITRCNLHAAINSGGLDNEALKQKRKDLASLISALLLVQIMKISKYENEQPILPFEKSIMTIRFWFLHLAVQP